MKTLVIGANGQLGWELIQTFVHRGMIARGVDLPEFDVTNNDQVFSIIGDEKPDCVVNASAYTHVDRAEVEKDTAYRVNRDGAGFIAHACEEYKIPMIHVSTDYVFDGNKNTPYRPIDVTAPLGVYGMSKEAGEHEVRNSLREHVIIRTSWLYGMHGMNFVKTMARIGVERDVIRVVNDQYGCPTYAGDLADAIAVVVESVKTKDDSLWGTYHYSGKGVTTWYEFAVEILRCVRNIKPLKVKDVQPIQTSEYPTPAKRPMYSVLDCSKIELKMNIMTKPWRESLEKTINEAWME